FLDEVAEMSPALQSALLRVLEDGRYTRVGDSRPCQADVRLVCATSRDLVAMVAEGAFRSDLYYRIRGATVTLPPLRARSDILELADGILAQLAEEAGEAAPHLDEAVRRVLVAHAWPGNVRELRMTLHYANVLAGGNGVITRDDLPAELLDAVAEAHGVGLEASPGGDEHGLLATSERHALEEALRTAGGNMTRAASLLGVARSTLYRMLRKHDLHG
ncbi:MAG: sigma 54-interacting transcriptional regulator, partial [Myxococcales bacterium]|nr:sigma 54-interacting transcriptional regulator [Myxococcales bacterium]